MNIIFMGTPVFAGISLKKILDSKHHVKAIVTSPDKPAGRGLKIRESEVKKIALQNNIELFQPEKLDNPEFLEKMKGLYPDLIVVVAFRILPEILFSLPKYGSVNLHASLLPKYRGAAPINWAIIKGEQITGVTTFFLKEKIDTGNIILQRKLFIGNKDNAGILQDKLAVLGADTIIETLDIIENTNGSPEVIVQDNTKASNAPKIFNKDCKINWGKKTKDVFNLIRGLSPSPGAYSLLDHKRIKIITASFSEIEDNEKKYSPSTILIRDNFIFTKCSDGFLKLEKIQPESKKIMSTSEFLKGYPKIQEQHFS